MKVRSLLSDFRPYEWEPTNAEIAAKVGLKPYEIIRFDTNTSPYTPHSLLLKLKTLLGKAKVNEYPDTSYVKIRQAFAEYNSCSINQITVTNGADEALDIISKVFIDVGTNAIVSVPTYSMYRIIVETMGGTLKTVLRTESFRDNIDAILRAVDKKTRIIFLCNPNNPTGNLIDRKDIILLLESTQCPVIVDESYFEFSQKTFADLTVQYDNCVIVRTLSKAFCLAGVRVGYVLASERTIALLNKMRPPNSLGVISLLLGEIAIENSSYMRRNVARTNREKKRLLGKLRQLRSVQPFPSDTNFLLVKFPGRNATTVHDHLLKKGLVTRDVSELPLLRNCLRFTVRTRADNDKLLSCLAEL